jgi:hypothetical protein
LQGVVAMKYVQHALPVCGVAVHVGLNAIYVALVQLPLPNQIAQCGHQHQGNNKI